jgi:hypothetical protein
MSNSINEPCKVWLQRLSLLLQCLQPLLRNAMIAGLGLPRSSKSIVNSTRLPRPGFFPINLGIWMRAHDTSDQPILLQASNALLQPAVPAIHIIQLLTHSAFFLSLCAQPSNRLRRVYEFLCDTESLPLCLFTPPLTLCQACSQSGFYIPEFSDVCSCFNYFRILLFVAKLRSRIHQAATLLIELAVKFSSFPSLPLALQHRSARLSTGIGF